MRLALFLVPAAFLASAAQTPADPFLAAHAAAVSNNPEHVRLDIVPAKETFYQGEIVAVTLRFTTDAAEHFTVSNVDHRLIQVDELHLDRPERTMDPLRDYYRAAGAEAGSILSSESRLSGTVDVPIVLNDRMRFDRPGRYRVYVVSRRLREFPEHAGDVVPVTSSIAAFEIVETDPVWAARHLAEASATID